MSKSVEELFKNAPEDATHYAKYCHYKVIGDTWMVYISDNEWVKSGSMYNGQIKPSDIIQRPQPKPWSGPEDGLPPVNARIYMHLDESDEWILGTVIAHVTLEDGDVAVAHNGKDVFNGYASDFRAIWTPESIESEKRESAIRELMDVAQVDCRVTAARLVDAGFKREVV